MGVLCWCGEMVTHEFEIVSNELKKCKWYLLPLEMQKILLILITNAQHSTFIRGYGDIRCTRETFLNVSLSRLSKQT